jgi:hypothetical protein
MIPRSKHILSWLPVSIVVREMGVAMSRRLPADIC